MLRPAQLPQVRGLSLITGLCLVDMRVPKTRSAYVLLMLLWVSWVKVNALTPDDPDGLYRSTGAL